MKILTEIVTFNPEIDRLKKNILNIVGQTDILLLVDNGSVNINNIEKLLSDNGWQQCVLVKNKQNEGIAKALNYGMEYARENFCDWILSLDQDTIFPENGVAAYCSYMKDYENAAIFSPKVFEENMSIVISDGKKVHGAEKVDQCITSGALTKVESWEKIGKYDEWMFIDSVDFEFCYRIIKENMDIIQVNEVIIRHQIGRGKKYIILGHELLVLNHSPERKYYIFRNYIYVLWKCKQLCFVQIFLHIVKEIFIIILFEKDKAAKILSITRGVRDSIRKIKMESI